MRLEKRIIFVTMWHIETTGKLVQPGVVFSARTKAKRVRYESLHRKVAPSKRGRGVVTPKLRASCALVPKRCRETGRNMYHVNEQAGEDIHVRAQKRRPAYRTDQLCWRTTTAPAIANENTSVVRRLKLDMGSKGQNRCRRKGNN